MNLKQMHREYLTLAAIGLAGLHVDAEPAARPMIWASVQDRSSIIEKIRSAGWAEAELKAMRSRVADAVALHSRDPGALLRKLPLVAFDGEPQRHPVLERNHQNMASVPPAERNVILQQYACIGVDCGVLYYLTGEAAYAQCAADILNVFVESLVQMEPDTSTFNGGWLYAQDHLYEARVVGAQLPVIYDFVAPYLRAGGSVHHVGTNKRESFNFAHAQQVFRTYARLALEHGLIDCNWPVLEMASLAHNLLALENPDERQRMLDQLIHVDTPHQDSFARVLEIFERSGAVWPESFNYAQAVAELTTYITALLLRSNVPVSLPDSFSLIPLSLKRITDFRYPNRESVRFGDGSRKTANRFDAYQMACLIGEQTGNRELQETFGALIEDGLRSGSYKREALRSYHLSPHPYLDPLALLWFPGQVASNGETTADASRAARTTDTLPFAGMVLQRNLSPDGLPEHGLMAAVSGAHYVHGHASGMSLELYGAGEVLGSPAGKGTYRTGEHENYRRIFAAYNCVIVNGQSASSGGWVNLGIDTVRPVSMEPQPGEQPVSPNNSFTLTTFEDRQLSGETAQQQRLVAIVRTSPATGYYVDVFRSRAAPESQFHDYLYHNIGDRLDLSSRSEPLPMTAAPERFQPAPETRWVSNDQYLFPGWHTFKGAACSAPHSGDVAAVFAASQHKPHPIGMRLFIPGTAGREYATARAPATRDAPPPYDSASTPVLAIRQHGPAWDKPFAVIYEPVAGDPAEGSIRSVEAILDQSGAFAGFKVVSSVEGREIRQLVLVGQSHDSEFKDQELDIEFQGRFAVITVDANGDCLQMYMGEGTRLRFRGHLLQSAPGRPAAAWSRT